MQCLSMLIVSWIISWGLTRVTDDERSQILLRR